VAVSSEQITVETSAVELSSAESGAVAGSKIMVTNGAAVVFLGGSGVTTLTGLSLAANATLTVELNHGERLYAICATSSDVSVLRTGV
jgi:hypothetical protein